MCQACGCGLSAESPEPPAGSGPSTPSNPSHPHPHHLRHPVHEPTHPHVHPHPDEFRAAGVHPDHAADPEPVPGSRILSVQQSLLDRNARLAEQNRGYFRAKKIFVLNVLSAPGSGKTAFIRATAEALKDRVRIGAIVGDLATENDATRLREAGIPVVQITTGTLCHLEAGMVARAMTGLDLDALDILFIENVGNLVCPASYDLGENLRVVLLSVTEGEDKPLKYPPVFHSADIAIVTKSDLAIAAGFQREAALANLRRISHHAQVFEVSARTSLGMQAWGECLLRRREEWNVEQRSL